jgi:hypothetical protein
LMVGGEYSTENDSTKGSARALVSKPLALSVAKSSDGIFSSLTRDSPSLTDTLTQTFLHPQLFPCSRAADHTLR